MPRLLPFIAPSFLVVACSTEYHPEYHPVTVSEFTQTLAYPVAVNNGPSPAPVYVVPGAPPPGLTAAPLVPAPEPPAGFFDRR